MSFGSAVKPSQMTKERRAIFLEVFSQLGDDDDGGGDDDGDDCGNDEGGDSGGGDDQGEKSNIPW